jgi:thioredoxin-dependent peroxiredoxin
MKTIALMLFSFLPFFGNAAERLDVGERLPDVTCNDQDGNPVNVAQFGAQGYLLVYFYPKANTPGCTKQGCSLRDNWQGLTALGVKILGVSTDNEESQKSFKNSQNFPFSLLADKDQKVAKAFYVPVRFGFASRSAYLFKNGVCVMADYDGHTGDQAQQIINFLSEKK